jgi:hypothetical protein
MATDTGRSHEPPVGLPVTLMHPTPAARPFHRQGWIYEEKYDGWRLVAYKRASKTPFVRTVLLDLNPTQRKIIDLLGLEQYRPS